MNKYRIVSSHQVCGFEPGSLVDGADLVGADVAHLISSGHIVPSSTARNSKPADDGEAVEEQLDNG